MRGGLCKMLRSRRADLQLLSQSRQGSINDVFPRNIVGAGGTGSRYMCRLLCVCFSPPPGGAATHHRGLLDPLWLQAPETHEVRVVTDEHQHWAGRSWQRH